MGPYQFKARVARLRLKGGDVRDFGERVLQQGTYGDDVMQLQVCWAETGAAGQGEQLARGSLVCARRMGAATRPCNAAAPATAQCSSCN